MIEGERPEEKGEVVTMEEVLINQSFPDQLVTIGGGLIEAGKDQLKCLLKDNVGVFAWEPSDMTGVLWRIIEHALNVNPSLDPVCQKQRTFSMKKSKVVKMRWPNGLRQQKWKGTWSGECMWMRGHQLR
nr:reverse transcriptase domain-containing protein [Tanacetum cinerariifolium]